jgi:hypothetical protein
MPISMVSNALSLFESASVVDSTTLATISKLLPFYCGQRIKIVPKIDINLGEPEGADPG